MHAAKNDHPADLIIESLGHHSIFAERADFFARVGERALTVSDGSELVRTCRLGGGVRHYSR